MLRSIKVYILLVNFFICRIGYAQPVISSFYPESGSVGTTVVISGNNFDMSPANNTVYFGAVKANVSSATATSITVSVPVGATYQPISVTVNFLTAYSEKPFVVTFSGGGNSFLQNSFSPKVDINTGNSYGVAIGDLDGDGKADLAGANNSQGTISIYRNTSSNGAVSFATEINYSAGTSTNSVTIGDINGDGKPDIAVTNRSSNTVSVFKNNSTVGSISFESKIDLATGDNPADVKMSDIDGDGKPELIVAGGNSQTLSVYRNITVNPATILFAAKIDFQGEGHPYRVEVADVDKDGKPDVITENTSYYYNSISIFRSISTTGTIAFESRKNFSTGSNPSGLAVGDLNNDGKPDFVTANNSYTINTPGTISILKNNSTPGSISVDPKIDYSLGSTYPNSVSITDIDGDGKPDLAVTYASLRASVAVFKNTSSNNSISFASKVDYAVGSGPTDVSIADINQDGKPDMVTSNHTSSISILKNKTADLFAVCPGGSSYVTVNISGFSYQWQMSTDSVHFNNISDNSNYTGSNTSTLQINNIPSSWNGYQYRCNVDGNLSNLYSIQILNYWIGINGFDWEDNSNWSCGVIPDEFTDVVISSGLSMYPTIHTNVSCHNLSVYTAASVTIAAGGRLIITGH